MNMMRNVKFIEKSSLFYSYKAILRFRNFDLKLSVEFFFSKYIFEELDELYLTTYNISEKKFYSIFELRVPYK